MADMVIDPAWAARLRAAWPALPVDTRQLFLDLAAALTGPESDLQALLEDLEDMYAYDVAKAAGGTPIPFIDNAAQTETAIGHRSTAYG